MKVLVIHHLEEIWNSGYKNAGTSFYDLEYKFFEFLSNNHFDKVILTKFELPTFNYFGKFNRSPEFINDYCNIWHFITNCFEYGYGWTKDCFEGPDCKYCKGGNHSEVVLIEEWMEELKDDEVFISGAFDGECIEDLEIALNYCNVNFKRIEELIV